MGITDAIKDSVMESFNTTLSTTDIILGLFVSLIAGLFILMVYRSVMRQVSANRSFCITLMLVCSISAMVVLTITSNLALSLGMVGALSIVRFRTAVKEATDTAFLFWAIATGILCGAGYVTISILATLLLGLLFMLIHVLGRKQKFGSYLIVIRYSADSPVEDKLMGLPGFTLKNKSMTREYTELVGEIRMKDGNPKALSGLRNVEGVREINIMTSTSGSTL